MEKKQTSIKYLLSEKAAKFLNLKKEQLINAFKAKEIKGYWISNTTENSFFLELDSLIKYCVDNVIDYENLTDIEIDPITRI